MNRRCEEGMVRVSIPTKLKVTGEGGSREKLREVN